MNIVLDCERMKYPNTGLYTFCGELAKAMLRTANKEDTLNCFIHPRNLGILGDDVKYITRGLFNKHFPVKIKGLDIWHTAYQLSRYYGGDKNTKNVLTIHDLNFLYEEKMKNYFHENIISHQKLIDRADYIVAISEFTKMDVLKYLDIKNKPISVIHNGAHLFSCDNFSQPKYEPLRPFIFSVGTVLPKKNFHVLPSLLVGNDLELVIAGNRSLYEEKIIAEAKKFGVERRLKIIGSISEKEKYWYMKNCTAFAFPSLAEGFGIPAIEAMSLGKPVFLSTLTSLPEIGGDCAYYFENFDPEYMQTVFLKSINHYQANNPAEKIKKHASKFNWDKCAQEYYSIYRKVLE